MACVPASVLLSEVARLFLQYVGTIYCQTLAISGASPICACFMVSDTSGCNPKHHIQTKSTAWRIAEITTEGLIAPRMNTRPFKDRPAVMRWSCAYVSGFFFASKHLALRPAAAAGIEYFLGSKRQKAAAVRTY